MQKKPVSSSFSDRLSHLAALAIPWIPRPLVRRISRRYIAGDDLQDAVRRVRDLNAAGFSATVDVLGESVSDWPRAERTADEYRQALRAIDAHGLRAELSVKPSALGLWLDPARCERLLDGLLAEAARHGTGVCIDMEDARCTQLEIDLFDRLRARHANAALALQSYLRRTDRDLAPLAAARCRLRLCKGIYREDPSLLVDGAATDRAAVNPHLLRHAAACFDAGAFAAVATHDEALVEAVVALARARGLGAADFEFQVLLGVCEPLRDRLRDEGFAVRVYVPYGRDWYGYSVRRMKENPRIAGHVLKALLLGR